jgi:signal transduction histidine kinase/ligand-binding sensor domain-containing protein
VALKWRGAMLALYAVAGVGRVHAVDDSLRISQYAHSAWRLQDGVFAGSPNAISQTRDGYLWIGTQAGLLRFDGVRFAAIDAQAGQELPSPHIFSLLGGSDGGLWIGTSLGLAHLRNGGVSSFKDETGFIGNITESRDGVIRIARSRTSNDHGGLCEVVDTSLRCYGAPGRMPIQNAQFVFADPAGDVWVGGEGVLVRWNARASTSYPVPNLRDVGALDSITAIAPAADGALWIGMVAAGPGLGLERFVDGKWSSWQTKAFDSASLAVSALLLDRNKALWVGTSNAGLYRIYQDRAEHYQSSDGLSSNTVKNIFEDREGNLWVATANGVDKFREVRVVSVSSREGLSSDEVQAVLPAHDGTVWLSNNDAIDNIRGGIVTAITKANGLPGKEVTSLLEDSSQRIWVGIDSGLFVMENNRFVPLTAADGKPLGTVTDLIEDSAHDVWAKTVGPHKLSRIRAFKVQKDDLPSAMNGAMSFAADPQAGIWLGLKDGTLARERNNKLEIYTFVRTAHRVIASINVAANGSVFGATAKGVVAWRQGVTRTLNTDNGLPCELVSALLTDARNDLWLYAQCGLIHIADKELQSWWTDGSYHVQFRLFDALDGVSVGRPPFGPQASLAKDGKLWFANETVAQFIDPANTAIDTTPAPVYIEGIKADRRPYAAQRAVQLPAMTRDLAIAYTALDLTIPERVLFRYKLLGHDVDWQDAGTRREAFYNDLGPGDYEFRVMATNHDGVWNLNGASQTFSIAAAWYQTRLFMVACALLAALFAWLAYRIRLRQIASSISLRFEERLAERTRLAQDLHDTLLQTIQGSKLVADDALEGTDPERMAATMRRISIWLGQAVQEGRAALNSLRYSMTEKNDLAEGFRRAAEECANQKAIEVSITVQGSSKDLHPIARDEVYRIGYEAITNACTHSGASRLAVELLYSHDLVLRVNDNGHGIDATILQQGKEGHFGLQGMRERAARIGGKIKIESSPTTGTQVELWVPKGIIFRDLPVKQSSLMKRLKSLFGFA